MSSWANPMRWLEPGSGDGVGDGLNSTEQVYAACVDWTNVRPTKTAATATTTTTPMIAVR